MQKIKIKVENKLLPGLYVQGLHDPELGLAIGARDGERIQGLDSWSALLSDYIKVIGDNQSFHYGPQALADIMDSNF